MNELERVVQRLCEAGADAIRRYVVASGQAADNMPEYYLTSSLFDSIGCGRSATLETTHEDIHSWIGESHLSKPLLEGRAKFKVDLVIYDGTDKHPDNQRVWALVEVKKGSVDADNWERTLRTDYKKLTETRDWNPAFRPHLICCGGVNAEDRQKSLERSNNQGDTWFEAATGLLPYEYPELFFCARVLRPEPKAK